MSFDSNNFTHPDNNNKPTYLDSSHPPLTHKKYIPYLSSSPIPVTLDAIKNTGIIPQQGWIKSSAHPQPSTTSRREARIIGSTFSVYRRCKNELNDAIASQNKQIPSCLFSYPPKTIFSYCSSLSDSLPLPNVGIAAMQGRRPTMEDTHLAVSFSFISAKTNIEASLYGIFDGHGGKEASSFLQNHLLRYLINNLQVFCCNKATPVAIFNALKLTFVELNKAFTGLGGSTATIAFILENDLWIANLGDSRAILVNGDEITQLSDDAKPGNEKFHRGIRKRNGFVLDYFGKRVGGVLAVARTIGDKEVQGINHRPKIVRYPLDAIQPDSYLLIACDGLWDVCSSEQAGRCIISDKDVLAPNIIAKKIVQAAYQAYSLDNISVLIAKLN